MIDGEFVMPVVYALSDFPGAKSNTVYAQRNIRNFGEQGINIVALDTELRLGWRKNLPFDPEPLISEISDALEARELIKLSVLENCGYTAREAADELAEALGAEVAGVIGRKIVLYRESSTKKRIEL